MNEVKRIVWFIYHCSCFINAAQIIRRRKGQQNNEINLLNKGVV